MSGASNGGSPAGGPTPDPRSDFERISAPAVRALSALPRGLVLVLVLAVMLAGLFLPAPAGPIVLLLLAAFLGWLLALGWPALAGPARFLRLVTVLLLAGVAGSRLVG